MKVGICNDHAGVVLKNKLTSVLKERGYEVVNIGTDSEESIDYPDVAHPLAGRIESGERDFGVAICGTGNGMALALNHHKGIRAGLAWNSEVASLVKRHNNANVLVLSARFVSDEQNIENLKAYLDASFEGGRHERRVEKILEF